MCPEPSAVPLEGTGDTIVVWGQHSAAVRTAGGAFLGFTASTEVLGAPADAPDAAAFMDRLTAERRSDALEARERRWPPAARAVVVGRGNLAAQVGAALTDWGARVEHRSAADAAAVADRTTLIIGVADTPPQRAGWAGLDAAARRGSAWIRAVREGGLYLVEPLAVEGHGPTAAQVLSRRRAASNAPQAWQAWWNAVAEADVPPGPFDRVAEAHQLSRLLELAAAWARGTAGLDETSLLLRYDAEAARLSHHRVLAFDPAPSTALSDGAVA